MIHPRDFDPLALIKGILQENYNREKAKREIERYIPVFEQKMKLHMQDMHDHIKQYQHQTI